MSNETKLTVEEQLAELTKDCETQPFFPELVSADSLKQMIMGHQLKYIENLIQVEEEVKLCEENIKDFLALPKEVQEAALKHKTGVLYDENYFAHNNVDESLRKPIMIAATIDAKREEAKTKTWTAKYHGRLIERLRVFLKQAEAHEQRILRQKMANEKPKTFWQKLKELFSQDDYQHEHTF